MKGQNTIEQAMFYGAKPETFAKAKELRNNETETEKKMWIALNNSDLKFKFRRQHPIDIFIVDFYCHKAKLVIEIDGEYHNKKEVQEYDTNRTSELEEKGLKIIRFSNTEVENNIVAVINTIKEIINKL